MTRPNERTSLAELRKLVADQFGKGGSVWDVQCGDDVVYKKGKVRTRHYWAVCLAIEIRSKDGTKQGARATLRDALKRKPRGGRRRR